MPRQLRFMSDLFMVARPRPGCLETDVRLTTLSLLLALSASPVAAQEEPPRATKVLVVYGDDPCPKSEGDEIVVCARRPDNERYRIPKSLRDAPRTDPASGSWASRWNGAEDAMRYTRPNSCSPVGTFGQTGCFEGLIRQWRAERNERRVEP
jgi:hypothetical protein